eukprot:NODE_252_length_2587_cov_23.295528_g235_i0.p1 GENE.NODE_252_length_2587_cov_23.295528_g235_i0~~NODE_252_length_2587_cov_23.295528_g235_i0.p1  ORF type:complete len:833 (-),score=193.15 NODE_252_length_2587_cov_23.295528_g235_i0:87-2585(-)
MANRFHLQSLVEEDDVVRKPQHDKLGVVERLGGDSDDEDPLPMDTLEVRWYKSMADSYLSTVKVTAVEVVDRCFGPSDIVSKYSDASAQMGIVEDIDIVVDAFAPLSRTRHVDINAKHLAPLHSFSQREVLLDLTPPSQTGQYRALGRIQECVFDLIICFKDKSQCLVERARPEALLSDATLDVLDEEFPFWPGQAVEDQNGRLFKTCAYLTGEHKRKHCTGGVVQYICPRTLHVELITITEDILRDVCPTEGVLVSVHPSQVIVFNSFWYAHTRMGDVAVLRRDTPAQPALLNCATVHPNQISGAMLFYGPYHEAGALKRPADDQAATLQHYRTQLKLCPPELPDGQIVYVVGIKTECGLRMQTGEQQRCAGKDLYTRNYLQDFDVFPNDLVKHSASGDKLGVVVEVNPTQKTAILRWLDSEDTSPPVSTYDLSAATPDEVELGDMVLWVPAADREKTLKLLWPESGDSEVVVTALGPTSLPYPCNEPPPAAVPAQVLSRHEDGTLTVLWGDGAVGRVNRMEVVAVPCEEDEDDDSTECSSEEETPEPPTEEEAPVPEVQQIAEQMSAMKLTYNLPDPVPTTLPSRLTFLEAPFKSHHFPSDGHPSKNVLRRVQEEWQILQAGLPAQGIQVQATHHNLLQLQILIEGAPHTPYHHAVFPFDLRLPDNYPHTPPRMFFHSYGVRLNPNLSHQDGSLCLSLLGTWNSPFEQEMWSPACNLLQVLLSIQSLVLCAEPYYNEGAYDRHVGAELNSRSYNEQIVLNKVRYMDQVAKAPPPDWSDVIQTYMESARPAALAALQPYLSTPPDTEAEGLLGTPSEGFATSLREVLKLLQ